MKYFPNYLMVNNTIPSKSIKQENITISANFEKEKDKRIEQKRTETINQELKSMQKKQREKVFKSTYIPTIIAHKQQIEIVSYQEIFEELNDFTDLLLFTDEDVEEQSFQATTGKLSKSEKKKAHLSLNTIMDNEVTPKFLKK